MKWYYAENVDSEHWAYGGESREEAIKAALESERHPDEGLPFVDLDRFAVAHENFKQMPDEVFWKAVASALCSCYLLEGADEYLGQESLINMEEGFLVDVEDSIEAALVAVLPLVLKRPEWRCIESAHMVTPGDRASDGPPPDFGDITVEEK